MKIVTLVARLLLALMFTVFGLNGFFHFLPMQTPPGLAGQFMTVMFASNYMVPVFLLQVVCGILFFANRYIPLALTLIGPVIVNILIFHLTMAPSGLVPGLIATICWFIVFYSVRSAFDGIFHAMPAVG